MGLSITIDAKSPTKLAAFWAEALPHYDVRPYDQAEIDRLAKLGLTPETDVSVPIDAPNAPTIWFQLSASETEGRNRIHLDLAFADRVTECQRLKKLGAIRKLERADHIVMLDPEGNQFCLFNPKH